MKLLVNYVNFHKSRYVLKLKSYWFKAVFRIRKKKKNLRIRVLSISQQLLKRTTFAKLQIIQEGIEEIDLF